MYYFIKSFSVYLIIILLFLTNSTYAIDNNINSIKSEIIKLVKTKGQLHYPTRDEFILLLKFINWYDNHLYQKNNHWILYQWNGYNDGFNTPQWATEVYPDNESGESHHMEVIITDYDNDNITEILYYDMLQGSMKADTLIYIFKIYDNDILPTEYLLQDKPYYNIDNPPFLIYKNEIYINLINNFAFDKDGNVVNPTDYRAVKFGYTKYKLYIKNKIITIINKTESK